VLPNFGEDISVFFSVSVCMALRDGTRDFGGALLLSRSQYRQVRLALFSCYKIRELRQLAELTNMHIYASLYNKLSSCLCFYINTI
jgi:hypothetical protein